MQHIVRATGQLIIIAVFLSGCGAAYDLGGTTEEARLLTSANTTDQAAAALYRGDPAEAARYAAAALRDNPKNPHALLVAGVANQALGNPDWARQYYDVIVTNNLHGTITVPGDSGGLQSRDVMDIARANLVALEKLTGRRTVGTPFESGRTPVQPVLNGPPLPLPLSRGVLSATSPSAERSTAAPRQNSAEANITNRFKILQRLRDESLITAEEYATRREANLGALLPSSRHAAAAGLAASSPEESAVISRLRDIARALENGEISPEQYSNERQAILESLLPANPRPQTSAAPDSRDVQQTAAQIGYTETLQKAGLITPEEAKRERSALERNYRTAQGASATPPDNLRAASTAPPRITAAPAAAGPVALAPADKPSATEPSSTPWGVALGTVNTASDVTGFWNKTKAKFPVELESLNAKPKRLERKDGQTIWQAVAGPLKDAEEAKTLCNTLRLHRQNCEPTRMP